MRRSEKPESLLLEQLFLNLFADAQHKCALKPSDIKKDIESFLTRFGSEGIAFLTKDLPALGKGLDKALGSDGNFPDVPGFAKAKNGYPRFLGAFWKLIFGTSDKEACTERCVSAVRCVRQICYLMYKLEGSHTLDSEISVQDKFVLIDDSLPEQGKEVPLSREALHALENARMLLWYVLESFDPGKIVPRHGPGAVSTGEKAHHKMNFSRIYSKLEEYYPFVDYFKLNYGHLAETLESLEDLDVIEGGGQAKVALVPKDSRGPRLISMEPLEYQWIQQGLLREFIALCENPKNICFGKVNFTNQEINRALALKASRDRTVETTDLSDASDRVSVWLVQKIFPEPLFNYLMAARSTSTVLPDGRRVELKKFAPMGNAICFPVEALVFWSIAVGTLYDGYIRRNSVLPDVHVFGDDLILPLGGLEKVEPVFDELFLKFNRDKCFTQGFFRESCGMDALFGFPVIPTRVKHWFGSSSPLAALSLLSYQNDFERKGYFSTSAFLRAEIAKRFGYFPVSNKAGAYPVLLDTRRETPDLLIELINTRKMRYNRYLQRYEVRLQLLESLVLTKGEPDWSELLRCWPHGSSKPMLFADITAPSPCQYPARSRVKLRWRWVDAFSVIPCG